MLPDRSILKGGKCQNSKLQIRFFFGQTVLPDSSILIGQKLVEKAGKFKWDILGNFQTL